MADSKLRARLGLLLAATLSLSLAGGVPVTAAETHAAPLASATGQAPADALTVLPSATPTISGTAGVGSTLTAKTSGWPSGTTRSYQWYADATAIRGATGPTLKLTSSQANKRITVAVTGSKSGYADATAVSAATAKVISPGKAAVSGSARVGSTLTVKRGTWTTGTSFSYQWYANGTAVRGATKTTFTPTTAHSGKAITVKVTGTRTGYATASATSAKTLRVMRSAKPTISGTVASGSRLTAKHGTWTSGTTFSYQWYANGTAIKNAKKSTLTLASAQKGKKISVKVTGSKPGHTKTAQTSKATAKTATAATPKVTGSALVGSKLTAKHGTWTSGTTFSYRWYANGKAISGATKSTYKVGSSAKGKKITVKVTGTKSGYAKVTKTSKATKGVPRTATPTISGTRKVGSTLTAKHGTWTSGTKFSYRWYANGKAISGATSSKLKLTSNLKGKKITVKVTGKKAGYTTKTTASQATAKITTPSRMTPSGWNCPSWAPIKGNASSMIYHMPSGAYYGRTNPEECFSTRAAAERAGYRASLR